MIDKVHTAGDVGHPMIELRRLHRFFGSTRAVNDISFEIEKGQVFGFIGPNGAGKTTSMRILATLDLPSYGDAFVDGFSAVNDAERVKRRLGFMPDAFGTYPDVNCREYLDFFARAYGLVGRERMKACQHVMGFTGLDVLATKPINGLSKGMKQRLCLGRALVHDPSVLILDEPAAGLDPRARIELREMIRELAVNGKTVMISSHILTELAEICDCVGIVERGELLAVGSVAEMESRLAKSASMRVTVLDRASQVAEWITSNNPDCKVKVIGNAIDFELPMDQRSQAKLLRGLIEAGFDVASFGVVDRNLEEVFLNVTKGRVQ